MTLQSKHHSLQQVIGSTVNQIRENKDQVVHDILTRVVIDCLKKYQLKVNAGVQDSVADLLDTFKLKVAREIFDIAQNWSLTTGREKVLFPRDCRFLYNIGNSTIVVLENGPGVRLLTLDRNLCGPAMQGSSRITERHALPLPYVVFVLHFVSGRPGGGNERLAGFYVQWNTAPLNSLQDMLYVPLFPNIHTNYSMCMGSSFHTSGNITEMCRETINAFWASAFNNDLSSFWWSKSDVDQRLRTVRSWVEAGQDETPLFMLNLPYQQAQTLESLINVCVGAHEEQEADSSAMRHRLAESIDRCGEQLFNKVLSYFRKTKFDRYYPQDVVENLGKSISSIADELVGIVLGIQMEMQDLSDQIHMNRKDESHFGWEPRGPFWRADT